MNIGETSAALPVIDAPSGAAGPVAASAAGAGFADRLAEALGTEDVAKPAVAAKADASASPEGTVSSAAVLLAVQGARAARVGAAPSAAGAAPGMPADGVAVPDGLPLGAEPCEPVAEAGVGDAPDAAAVDAGLAGAASEAVGPAVGLGDAAGAPVAVVAADEPALAEDEVAALDGAEAVDVPDAVAAAVLAPVAVPVAAVVQPVAGSEAGGARGTAEGVAAVGRGVEGPGAAGPVERDAVAVTVSLRTGSVPLSPVAVAALPAGAVSQEAGGETTVSDNVANEGADEVALTGRPAKAKAAQATVLVDLPPMRVAEPVAVAAPVVAAATKPVAAEAVMPEGAGAPVQQMAQALPVGTEKLVAQPLRTDLPGWERVLSERIVAELSEDGQEIELSLSPEKLGPLRIKLEMVDGLAQVRFITATPEAARVFNEAQHRLTEGLARAGIDLGSQSAQSEGQGGRPAEDRTAPRGRMNEFLTHALRAEAGDVPALRRAGAGLVNLMA